MNEHIRERCAAGERRCKRKRMANKSVRKSSWLELELTVATIKPVTVRSNLNYYTSQYGWCHQVIAYLAHSVVFTICRLDIIIAIHLHDNFIGNINRSVGPENTLSC